MLDLRPLPSALVFPEVSLLRQRKIEAYRKRHGQDIANEVVPAMERIYPKTNTMIHEEFKTMLKAAYGDVEIPADQESELRLCFARGVALGYSATVKSVLETTKTKNITEALFNEINAELKAASGPAIVLEPMEFKLESVEPPATPEEAKAIMDETLEQIRQQ